MEMQESGSERPGRGRVVMLVDNKVEGDSRVQKAAESMAAAGWDVTLLGLVRSGKGRSWKLGDAEVRLLPLKTPLAKRHAERHRSLLRRPLAYPPGPWPRTAGSGQRRGAPMSRPVGPRSRWHRRQSARRDSGRRSRSASWWQGRHRR